MCGHVPTNYFKTQTEAWFQRWRDCTTTEKMDVWYANWVSITGREGIDNYIRMLGVGHMDYYLKNYCNVYSDIGASEQNSKEDVSSKNTKRVGEHGKYISEEYPEFDKCPHTIPIAQWLQRVMMWNTGMGEV